MNRVELDKKVLKAICAIASLDDFHYAICSLRFEFTKKELLVIATDGHRLAVVKTTAKEVARNEKWKRIDIDENAEFAPGNFLLNAAEIKKGIDATRDKQARFTFHKRSATITHRKQLSMKIVLRNQDGKYPDWRKVVPPAKDTFPLQKFDPDILAGLSAIATAINDNCGGVLLQQHSDEGAISVLVNDVEGYGYGFYGLLMPIRCDALPERPDFIPEPKGTPDAKASDSV